MTGEVDFNDLITQVDWDHSVHQGWLPPRWVEHLGHWIFFHVGKEDDSDDMVEHERVTFANQSNRWVAHPHYVQPTCIKGFDIEKAEHFYPHQKDLAILKKWKELGLREGCGTIDRDVVKNIWGHDMQPIICEDDWFEGGSGWHCRRVCPRGKWEALGPGDCDT